jgi:hypothetical protein
MTYNFFLEMIGCDPPLMCDRALSSRRVRRPGNKHQKKDRKQRADNLSPMDDPDCKDCAVDER